MRSFRLTFLVAAVSVLGSAQWTSQDKIALTYYFYWYNVHTGLHFTDNSLDALTLHPPDDYLSTYSYTDLAFHMRELSDMAAAGIDVALPVFWGDAANVRLWSVPGLQVMVQAEQAMAQAGQPAPKIGMFADITSLQASNGGKHPDLTTPAGKSLLYGEIHTFFSSVPQQYWAMIDGRPIVVFYISAFVSDYDQTTFDYLAQRFQQDFGTTPYTIVHRSWLAGTAPDAYYTGWPTWYSAGWLDDVASVTPGGDNLAVAQAEGRHIVVDRNCGDRYQQQWNQVLAHDIRLVLVETWNELHEGSGVSATKEYGRRYIDQTAQNVALWKSATPNPSPPDMVWVSLGPQIYSSGMWPATNYGAAAWLTAQIAGHDAIYVDRSSPANSIWLAVDDTFLTSGSEEVWVTVEYLDTGASPWVLAYDAASGVNTGLPPVKPQNTGLWKVQTFHLPNAKFRKREGGAADLTIIDNGPDTHYFNRIWITKSPPSGQASQMPLLPDATMQPGDSADIAVTASDASGVPLPVSLGVSPGFASLTGAQTINLSPSASDVRSCADVTGPGVTSSPSYVISAVASDPNNPLSSGASTFSVTVAVPDQAPSNQGTAARPPL